MQAPLAVAQTSEAVRRPAASYVRRRRSPPLLAYSDVCGRGAVFAAPVEPWPDSATLVEVAESLRLSRLPSRS